jgi:hypothetical protein
MKHEAKLACHGLMSAQIIEAGKRLQRGPDTVMETSYDRPGFV